MRRAIILVLLYAGIELVLPLGAASPGSQSVLTLGFLILAAYTVGEVLAALRLPRILGYLIAGVVSGPAVLSIFEEPVVASLQPVSSLAIALIAFLAGAELQWGEVRTRGVTILKILSSELVFSFLGLFVTLYLLHGFLPFIAGAPTRDVVAFTLVFAAIAIVHSPAVTMALLSETGARGPVARTTLGVVLVADVAVILFFSGALAVARALVPPSAGAEGTSFGVVAWEVGGAVLVGAAMGAAVALYLRFVKHELFIFALVVAFFGAEIARLLHVETLLTLLFAGFVAENAGGGNGQALRHAMERAAAPVFVVFFALAGAHIDVQALGTFWPLVIPLVIVRALGIFAGVWVGARWARAEAGEGRYVWMGLISQAGVAIGLATVVAQVYPARGVQLQSLFLAVIAVNESIGPVLFRRALVQSGEVEDAPADAPRPATAH
jgi:Kef-type K+ transport system membrane component KefB